MEPKVYVHDVIAPVRFGGGAPSAVVLYHEGRLHFATQGSREERDLLSAGAVTVGHLRFDRPPEAREVLARRRFIVSLLRDPGRAWGSTRN